MKRQWMKVWGVLALAGALGATSAAAAIEVAKVNGKPVTSDDLNRLLSGFNEGQRQSYLKDPTTRQRIVDQAIDQRLLAEQGAKEKLDQNSEIKALVEGYKEQLIATRLIERNVSSKITNQALKAHYEQNKRRYSTDEIQVQHILVSTEARAKELLAQARAKDADFQKLAEQFSEDPSAKNNRGDIGNISWSGPFVPEFKDAAFSTKVNEISGPVRTLYGYHIIKVVKYQTGRALNFEEVELRVREDLRAELTQDYLSKLRRQAKVTIDSQALNKL